MNKNRLSRLIASKGLREPSFRMIVTAVGEYAYTRSEDGIIVATLRSVGAELQVCTDLVEGDWKGVVESDIVDGVYTMPSATNAFARIACTLR